MKTALFFTDEEINILILSIKEHEEKNYMNKDNKWQIQINKLIETLNKRGVEIK